MIDAAPLARIDYLELVHAETLQSVQAARPNTVLLVAVFFGKTRLIDNIRLAEVTQAIRLHLRQSSVSLRSYADPEDRSLDEA